MARNAGQAATPLPPASKQDLNDAYADLLDHLNEAYWAAGTREAKERIKRMIDAVTDAVTALDAADLTARDAAYTALNTKVVAVNGQLQTLQKEINGIVSKINAAKAIVEDITKVISVAAKVFSAI